MYIKNAKEIPDNFRDNIFLQLKKEKKSCLEYCDLSHYVQS